MGMALLVLLAACANLGGLFAARAADRGRELGIRIAIGCSRKRILRRLLTESVLLAAMGGAAATLVASLLLRGLAAWHPGTEIPVQFLVAPDGSTIAFAALMALLSGLLFGLTPVRQALRTDPNQVLKSSGSTYGGSRRIAPARSLASSANRLVLLARDRVVCGSPSTGANLAHAAGLSTRWRGLLRVWAPWLRCLPAAFLPESRCALPVARRNRKALTGPTPKNQPRATKRIVYQLPFRISVA
jgi:hypothetical protein